MNIGKNVGRIAAVGTYMTGNKLWFFLECIAMACFTPNRKAPILHIINPRKIEHAARLCCFLKIR